MTSSIKTVGVVGTGVIGSSWIGLFLAKGLRVVVASVGADVEQLLFNDLHVIWPLLERQGLTPGASLSNCKFVGDSLAGHYGELDFVQENVPEQIPMKARIIAELDEGTREDVVIASSSSGITIVPVHQRLQEESGPRKEPVCVRQETPGFVANRLQAALNHEAFSLVQRGVVTAKELDICMMSSLGPAWAITGPLTRDFLGGGTGGFQHIMRHIGPGMQEWLRDMTAHSYEYTEANGKVLNDSVKEMLAGVDMEKLENARNEMMIELLKAKRANPALI